MRLNTKVRRQTRTLPDELPGLRRCITLAWLPETEAKLPAETGQGPVHVEDPAVLLHLGVLGGQQVVDHVVPEHICQSRIKIKSIRD